MTVTTVCPNQVVQQRTEVNVRLLRAAMQRATHAASAYFVSLASVAWEANDAARIVAQRYDCNSHNVASRFRRNGYPSPREVVHTCRMSLLADLRLGGYSDERIALVLSWADARAVQYQRRRFPQRWSVDPDVSVRVLCRTLERVRWGSFDPFA